MTHTCVGKLTINGSENGLTPGWRHAIIWSNAGMLLTGSLGMNCSDFLIGIHTVTSMSYSSVTIWICDLAENIVFQAFIVLACPLHWRHNDHDGVSNHQPHGCLLNRLFRRISKKASKPRVTGLCAGKSQGPVNPAQRASYAENVSIWWSHHVGGEMKSARELFIHLNTGKNHLHFVDHFQIFPVGFHLLFKITNDWAPAMH